MLSMIKSAVVESRAADIRVICMFVCVCVCMDVCMVKSAVVESRAAGVSCDMYVCVYVCIDHVVHDQIRGRGVKSCRHTCEVHIHMHMYVCLVFICNLFVCINI